ncbi:MAG TPA: cupredoxin family copper-binding protein [Steroidobacteraceae bacterium]|nr:cupredoxin family copper-binding protein [Steroidobacteraceae bacterium]
MTLGNGRILLPILCATLLGGAALGARAWAEAPTPETVVIKDFMFAPMSVTIRAGAQVVWVNHDDEPHSVLSETGLFRSGALDTGEKYAFRFDKPGTYHFLCSIHPRMAGTIVVQ